MLILGEAGLRGTRYENCQKLVALMGCGLRCALKPVILSRKFLPEVIKNPASGIGGEIRTSYHYFKDGHNCHCGVGLGVSIPQVSFDPEDNLRFFEYWSKLCSREVYGVTREKFTELSVTIFQRIADFSALPPETNTEEEINLVTQHYTSRIGCCFSATRAGEGVVFWLHKAFDKCWGGQLFDLSFALSLILLFAVSLILL